MILNKHVRKFKKEKAKEIEYNNIRRKNIFEKKAVPLDKPYQDGWIIYIDVREDFKRSPYFPELNRLLKLTTISFTKDVKLVQLVRKNKTIEKCRNAVGAYRNFPGFRTLSEKDYERLDDSLKEHFYKSTGYTKFFGTVYPKSSYHFTGKLYMFTTKVKPRMISEKYEIDPELMSRERILSDELFRSNKKHWRSSSRFDKQFRNPSKKERRVFRDTIQKLKTNKIENL